MHERVEDRGQAGRVEHDQQREAGQGQRQHARQPRRRDRAAQAAADPGGEQEGEEHHAQRVDGVAEEEDGLLHQGDLHHDEGHAQAGEIEEEGELPPGLAQEQPAP